MDEEQGEEGAPGFAREAHGEPGDVEEQHDEGVRPRPVGKHSGYSYIYHPVISGEYFLHKSTAQS